jgi:hypothetical protein
MLHFAANTGDSEVRRGAYRVIYGTSFSYTIYYNRARLRSPRFLGLADMHRELCSSSDREARMAAIGLFLIRKSWTQSASKWIRVLFQQCESDDEASLLHHLIATELQSEERRLTLWRQILTDLLDDRLYNSLNTAVQEALNRVLETTNQSLGASQKQLGLPLASNGSR